MASQCLELYIKLIIYYLIIHSEEFFREIACHACKNSRSGEFSLWPVFYDHYSGAKTDEDNTKKKKE